MAIVLAVATAVATGVITNILAPGLSALLVVEVDGAVLVMGTAALGAFVYTVVRAAIATVGGAKPPLVLRIGEGVAPLLILGLGALALTSGAIAYLFVALSILGSVAYFVLEATIEEHLDDASSAAVIPTFAKEHPFGRWCMRIRRRLEIDAFKPCWRFVDWLAHTRDHKIPGLVALVAACLFAGGCVGGLKAVTLEIADVTRQKEAPAVPKAGGAQPPRSPIAAATTVPPPGRSATFDDLCGVGAAERLLTEAQHLGAPGLYNLYLGPGGIGAVNGGCPAPAARRTATSGQLWFEAGYTSAGDLLTIGIVPDVGERISGDPLQPTILQGEVATSAYRQLNSGAGLAASPRAVIGNGDLQLLYTSSGTVTFVRAQQRLGGAPAPYVVLDPVSTEAWVKAMQTLHKWLWPESTDNGYALSEQPFRTPVATITSTSSQVNSALLGIGNVIVVLRHGYEFSLTSILQYQTARQE